MPRAAKHDEVVDPGDFTCMWCRRPEETLTPKIDEDGELLHPSEVLEIYNERRYLHYLNDFDQASELRAHLTQRCRYWAQGDHLKLEQEKQTIGATLEWWGLARRVRHEAKQDQAKKLEAARQLHEETKQQPAGAEA
ncbi:MAG: hypothetical protein ABIW84_01810 [Ilumatobacteraceae bacterium]